MLMSQGRWFETFVRCSTNTLNRSSPQNVRSESLHVVERNFLPRYNFGTNFASFKNAQNSLLDHRSILQYRICRNRSPGLVFRFCYPAGQESQNMGKIQAPGLLFYQSWEIRMNRTSAINRYATIRIRQITAVLRCCNCLWQRAQFPVNPEHIYAWLLGGFYFVTGLVFLGSGEKS